MKAVGLAPTPAPDPQVRMQKHNRLDHPNRPTWASAADQGVRPTNSVFNRASPPSRQQIPSQHLFQLMQHRTPCFDRLLLISERYHPIAGLRRDANL